MDGAKVRGNDVDAPEPNEAGAGSNWGILIFPSRDEGVLGWTLAEGMCARDDTTGRYILSPATPPQGVFEGEASYPELALEDRVRAHMALVPRQHVDSLANLASTVYWEASVLSGEETTGEFQLFRKLLGEWVRTMRRRGEDPQARLAVLIHTADHTGSPSSGHDGEPRTSNVGGIRPPVDPQTFQRVRQEVMTRYQPGRIEGWSDDVDHALFASRLFEQDQRFQESGSKGSMIVARCTAHPRVTTDQVAQELERIWSRELSYGAWSVEEAHTVVIEDETVVLRWVVSTSGGHYITGDIMVALQAAEQ